MSRTHHARHPRLRRMCPCGRREERCLDVLATRIGRVQHLSAVTRASCTSRAMGELVRATLQQARRPPAPPTGTFTITFTGSGGTISETVPLRWFEDTLGPDEDAS